MFIEKSRLNRLTTAIVRHMGSGAAEAALVSDHLVQANLSGHDSHGVGMLPHYLRSLNVNRLKPNTTAECVKDGGSIMIFDGHLGFGQRVAHDAMDAALGRCRQTGVTLLALRHAHHIGRIGTYGEQAIKEGMVSLHFVNVRDHEPWVTPFGGAAARFVTNPMCIAMPGTASSGPIVLDMATSRIAVGKVRVAMNKGLSLPDGMLMDNQGQPTNDPSTLFSDPKQSSLMPFGEHKGYGLALFCELLAGVLGGGGTIQPGNERLNGIMNNMLAIIIDPARLVDHAWMQQEIDALMAYIKSSPPAQGADAVLVAGDPERQARAQRGAEGIPIDPTTWEQLLQTAEAVGLTRSDALAIVQDGA